MVVRLVRRYGSSVCAVLRTRSVNAFSFVREGVSNMTFQTATGQSVTMGLSWAPSGTSEGVCKDTQTRPYC
jgi:hypothetical protein